jgi:hypothetical protein
LLQSNQAVAAQGKLEQALQLYRAIADSDGQQEALLRLSFVYYRQGSYFNSSLLPAHQHSRDGYPTVNSVDLLNTDQQGCLFFTASE